MSGLSWISRKIIATAVICFFPIVVNTYAGMRSIERDIGNLMTSLQATRLQVLVKVKFPAAVPFIFAGFKNAVVFAVIGALVAEWVGATGGLGAVIITALGVFETPATSRVMCQGERGCLLPVLCFCG